MDSNSQWDQAQAEWRAAAARRHSEQTATDRYAAGHRRTLENEPPRFEAVQDDPMPDYEAGETPTAWE